MQRGWVEPKGPSGRVCYRFASRGVQVRGGGQAQVTINDWTILGTALGGLGLLATIVGLKFAYDQLVKAETQLKKTETAVEASRVAVERASKRASASQLLSVLSRFRRIDSDLDSAIAHDDRDHARRVLLAFTHDANEAVVLLAQWSDLIDHDILNQLTETAELASDVKAEIASSSKKVTSLTGDVHASIGRVSAKAAALASKIQSEVVKND